MKNTPIFSIRKITLIALLSTLAYIGRLLFAWIPNVQPVTVILLIITLEMGLVEGILTASLSMILSNIFLGMGPWTLYQIASFAIVILVFFCLKPLWRQTWKQPLLKLTFFTIMAGLTGYLYGFVISIFSVYFYHIPKFWVYYFQGLPFDTLHTLGNIGFWILLSPLLPRIIQKYQTKFQ